MNAPTKYFVHTEDWQQIAFFPADQAEAIDAWLQEDDEAIKPSDLRGLNIPLADFSALLRPHLTETAQLFTGYTNDQALVAEGFAFYDPDLGAFYGKSENGILTELYFDNQFCDCGVDFSGAFEAVETAARQYDLVMVDWLLGMVSDLRQAESLATYFDEM